MRERSGAVDRLTAPVRAAAQRAAVPFLIFLSAMFIVLGKADIVVFERLRVGVADAASPILQAVAQPIATAAAGVRNIQAMFGVYQENQRLHEENARLLQWQEVARRLEAENAQLRGLVRFAPENAVRYVSARVIGNSGGGFARNVLVNAGSRDGVARGQAAVTGEGLAGRVTEVGERAARILLLTDLNSRIPVVLEDSRQRAVMAGDNSDEPRLLYVPANVQVKVGERIVTGGAGGVFPPGLPVGVVASTDGGVIRVEPFAELSRLEYVRVVDFGLEGVLPQSAVPLPKAPKGVRVVDPDLTR
ncbi:MAG TPA: rod shape-determining protein MreC [Stellaceae bacterium]